MILMKYIVLMMTALYALLFFDIDTESSNVSVANEATFSTGMMTTQVYSSPSSYSTVVTMMTDDMNTTVYIAVIDSESFVDITTKTTSLSNDIDTESSTVSVANDVTSSYDLSNNNTSSLNYHNDLHFDTVLYLVFIEILLHDQQNVLSCSTSTTNTLQSQQLKLLSCNTTSSAVRSIDAVVSTTYVRIYYLYFNTLVAITVSFAPVVAVSAHSVVATTTCNSSYYHTGTVLLIHHSFTFTYN